MTSLVFWPFLTYLPTYLVLLYNVPFWGYLGPPRLPTLIWDVINERFLKSCKKGQIYLEHLNNRFSLSCFFRALVYSLTILKANTHPFILMVVATLKQVAIKEITDNFNILISDCGVWTAVI